LLCVLALMPHVTAGRRLGDRFEAYPCGAVLIRDERTLVVSDLHLGCEAVLEYEGLSLPRVQTSRIEQTLAELVRSVSPDRLVVAGDLKHNFSRNLIQEWTDVSSFVRRLSGLAPVAVVKGNHDNYLGTILRELGLHLTPEARVGGVRVVHGHSGRLTAQPTVMGHIHPSISLRDELGVSVKVPCFLYDPRREIVVLPAMSLVAGGSDVVHQPSTDEMSPLLAPAGLSDFEPLVFSGTDALRFPMIGKMRKTEGV